MSVHPRSSRNFNFFKNNLWRYFLRCFYLAIQFMLRFKITDLQLFRDWLIHIFHYFTCRERDFQHFKTYVIKDTFSRPFNLCYFFDWLIYMFSTISPLRKQNFNVFKHMLLRYFFKTLLLTSAIWFMLSFKWLIYYFTY